MCGVLGVFALDGASVPARHVSRLARLLDHRGPDDSDVVNLGSATFGLTRLSILGVNVDEARQPVARSDALLSFNGEIYNFKDLALDLKSDGVPCSGASDTEVLFLCLRHWGVDRTLRRIDGMFGFAYYDDRERTVFLARDPLGEKSIYWALGDKKLWFASEIKVLLASGEVSSAPNLGRIDDYFYTAKLNGAETMFQDVMELEPGTCLRVSPDRPDPEISVFWCLENEILNNSETGGDRAADAFLDRLREAVRSRSISDVPVGLLLSGGIDSSALAELMLQLTSDRRLDVFFADNVNDEVSERTAANTVVRELGERYPLSNIAMESHTLDRSSYFAELNRLTWYYDEPIQFVNTPLLGTLCSAAQHKDVKVLFSGEGSDEILFGYERFARTSDLLRDVSDRSTRIAHLYFGGGMHSVDIVERLTKCVADGADTTSPWKWLDANLDRWDLDQLQMLFSQKYRLQMLLQRQDRIGMAHSVEIRVPFLSPSFLTWTNNLPHEAKYDRSTGNPKRALRDAMRTRLSQQIVERPKVGFPSDMDVWLRGTVLQEVANDIIRSANGFCLSYLRGDVVIEILEDHFSGKAPRDRMLWRLLSLEIWHRTFERGVALPAAA